MPGRSKSVGEDYRFAWNGQEKSPEISSGHQTALFWEYDSRSVHRWNVDPVPEPYLSSYHINRGNPILNMDPYGDFAIPVPVVIGWLWNAWRATSTARKVYSGFQMARAMTATKSIGVGTVNNPYILERDNAQVLSTPAPTGMIVPSRGATITTTEGVIATPTSDEIMTGLVNDIDIAIQVTPDMGEILPDGAIMMAKKYSKKAFRKAQDKNSRGKELNAEEQAAFDEWSEYGKYPRGKNHGNHIDNPNKSGNYHLEFDTGKVYNGKGPLKRMFESITKLSLEYGAKVLRWTFRSAKNNRESIPRERKAIKRDGGKNSKDTYNKTDGNKG